MIILGKGEWAIDSDKYQWRLLKKAGVDNDGEVRYRAEYYFNTLAALVKYLFELKVRESEHRSIEELSKSVKEIYEQIIVDFGSIERN